MGVGEGNMVTTDDHERHDVNYFDHGTEGGEGPSNEGIGEKCEVLKFQGRCMLSYLMSGKEQEDQVGQW